MAAFCIPPTRGSVDRPVPFNLPFQNAPRRHRLAPYPAPRFPLPETHKPETGPPERSPGRSDCKTILPPSGQASVQPEPRPHELHRRRRQGMSRVSIHDRPDNAADNENIPPAGRIPTSDKNAWLSKPFRVDASAQRRRAGPRSQGSARDRQRDVRPRPQQRTGRTKIQSRRCRVRPGTTIIGPLITGAKNATMNGTDYILPVEPSSTTPKATQPTTPRSTSHGPPNSTPSQSRGRTAQNPPTRNGGSNGPPFRYPAPR